MAYQPVPNPLPVTDNSGSLTVDQPVGSNLHVVVDTAPTTAVTNAGLSNLDVLLSTRTKPSDQQHVIVDSSASVAVTGPLTDTQLRAVAVPVSGSVASTSTDAATVALLAYHVNQQSAALNAMVTELRVISLLLQSGLNVREELDTLRADPSFSPTS